MSKGWSKKRWAAHNARVERKEAERMAIGSGGITDSGLRPVKDEREPALTVAELKGQRTPIEQLDARALDAAVFRNIDVDMHLSRVPHYSNDPYACKRLREKMRTDGYASSIIDDRADMMIEARFRRRGMDLGCSFFIGLEDTEERAVCLAALRAKGVTEV